MDQILWWQKLKDRVNAIIFLSLLPIALYGCVNWKLRNSSPVEKKLILDLESKNFQCDIYTRGTNKTYECRGSADFYPRPIRVYFTDHIFHPNPPLIGLHFHGFVKYPEWDSFNRNSGEGDYDKFILDSQKNVLFVIPESEGFNSTYNDFFTSPEVTEKFVLNLLPWLRKNFQPEGVSFKSKIDFLSFHSGSDNLGARLAQWIDADSLPSLKSVRNLALYDSLYHKASLEGWNVWLKILNRHRGYLYLSYNNDMLTDASPIRSARYQDLAGQAESGLRLVVRPSPIPHMSHMKQFMAEFVRGCEE